MLNKNKIITVIPARNEENIISHLVSGISRDFIDCVLVVDDASSDATSLIAKKAQAVVISHDKRLGCGPAIRTGIEYAISNGYDIIVVMAGNGKDDPNQIIDLLNEISKNNLDFVQGSRYLKGGVSKNMPFHRVIGTKAYSFLFSVLVGHKITDGTNGFRAFRVSLFKDKRINIWQDWIKNYELESYLYYKTANLGYRIKEVPVSKIYPKDTSKGYTQMKPFSGWWSHFRPVFLLSLGIKK